MDVGVGVAVEVDVGVGVDGEVTVGVGVDVEVDVGVGVDVGVRSACTPGRKNLSARTRSMTALRTVAAKVIFITYSCKGSTRVF